MEIEHFTEVLKQAIKVFGTLTAANEWLNKPAMGLNQQVPLALMQTDEGREEVMSFLVRLEYNAYT